MAQDKELEKLAQDLIITEKQQEDVGRGAATDDGGHPLGDEDPTVQDAEETADHVR